MENASKALLMAGGILIALLVIGALLLMFNQLGSYQDTKSNAEKVTQIADFNRDFAKYTESKNLKGTDIATLAFKIDDYNLKEDKSLSSTSTANSVDYGIKMTLKLENMGEFNNKYVTTLFTSTCEVSYPLRNDHTNKNLMTILNKFKSVDVNLLKKMAAIYSPAESNDVNKAKIKEALLKIDGSTYSSWNGTNMDPTYDAIKNYKPYSEFKTSTFELTSEPEYAPNGQIKGFIFKFIK